MKDLTPFSRAQRGGVHSIGWLGGILLSLRIGRKEQFVLYSTAIQINGEFN